MLLSCVVEVRSELNSIEQTVRTLRCQRRPVGKYSLESVSQKLLATFEIVVYESANINDIFSGRLRHEQFALPHIILRCHELRNGLFHLYTISLRKMFVAKKSKE